MQKENVVIIGSGPAGLTAALYTARARLNPVVLSGNLLGGQISLTSDVENYPGFPEGTSGPELAGLMQAQAERFGARIVFAEVTGVDFRNGAPFTVQTHDEIYHAGSVIVCTGASAHKLEIPGEVELTGRGVSYCATCDGFFFREKDVIVVGGGDSALEEALFLTRFAGSIKIVHRRDELRAGEHLKERAMAHEKISFVWDSVLTDIIGDEKITAVKTRNVKSGAVGEITTDGVFVFIGHYPNSTLFKGQLTMDARNYLVTDDHQMTSVPGVFAAGEVQDPLFRQIASSVGQGCGAAIMCERWLEEQK